MSLLQKIKTGNIHPMVAIGMLFMVLVAALALATTMDYEDDETLEVRHYCLMVDIFIQTDGVHGWPDYNGNYSKLCR